MEKVTLLLQWCGGTGRTPLNNRVVSTIHNYISPYLPISYRTCFRSSSWNLLFTAWAHIIPASQLTTSPKRSTTTGNNQLMSQEVSYVLVQYSYDQTHSILFRISYLDLSHYIHNYTTTPYAGCNMYRGNTISYHPSKHSSNPTHVRGRPILHEAYCVLFLRSFLIREEPSARSALNISPKLIYKSSLFNCISLYVPHT